MTTSPLPLAIINKIASTRQSVQWAATLKEVREFRAYCCNIDSDAIMGVSKEPVPILDLSPNPACVDGIVNWDGTSSYAPGSTITSWQIDFGDGSPTVSDNDIATASGQKVYTVAGTYDVTFYIQEGLGLNQTITVEVTVVNCGEVLFSSPYTYVSTSTRGVWFIDWTDAVPAWEERNTGLAGNALIVRSLVMKPSTAKLPDNLQVLWAATYDGVYKTEDGGRSWAKVTLPDPSNVEFADSPAATVDELDWYHIVFDSTDEDKIYVLSGKEV